MSSNVVPLGVASPSSNTH